jgi:hypothetical protein
MERPVAWWIFPTVPLVSAAIAFAWILRGELMRLYGMTGSAWDFAYDQQVIWNISVGQGFYSSFARANFLGIHFELIFVLLAAVEKLWPNPAVLLIFSSAGLAATAPAGYLFFRSLLPADRPASPWPPPSPSGPRSRRPGATSFTPRTWPSPSPCSPAGRASEDTAWRCGSCACSSSRARRTRSTQSG